MGGYFICNGIERIIRMITLQRRHYIMALRRNAYRKRGANYTDAAVAIRSGVPASPYKSTASIQVGSGRIVLGMMCTPVPNTECAEQIFPARFANLLQYVHRRWS